jgi:hypothetical protein
MFCFTARPNDVIFFPDKILDACELAGQGEMLCEMVEIAFEGLGIDLRDLRCSKDGGNALSLFVQFGHSVTSHDKVVRMRR